MSKTYFFICERHGCNYSIKSSITWEGFKIPNYANLFNTDTTGPETKLSQLKKKYNAKNGNNIIIVPFCYDLEAPGYWVQCIYECENTRTYDKVYSVVNKNPIHRNEMNFTQCLCGKYFPDRKWVSELTNEEYHEIDA